MSKSLNIQSYLDSRLETPVSEDLSKSPQIHEGAQWRDPIQPDKRSNHIGSVSLENGLYHHIFNNGQHYEHILSDSPEPRDHGITHVVGYKDGDTLHIRSSHTNPYLTGKGYGKKTYSEVLKYHGNIHSDHLVSRAADKIYRHLSTLPGVTVSLGRIGSNVSHKATLHKSLSPSSSKVLKDASVPKEQSIVDHEPHTIKGAPGPMKRLIESPEEVKEADLDPMTELSTKGASNKTIHDVSKFQGDEAKDKLRSNIVMTKPYNHEPNQGYKLPIFGWSTITTKHLFNAAGLQDACEDVYASTVNDIPLTHHVFEPESYRMVGDSSEFKAHPVDVGKIAVMDYLTGNLDRHDANLLIDPSKERDNLVAIDHERNFQYVKPIAKHMFASEADYDLPGDYIHNSSGLSAVNSDHKAYMLSSDSDRHDLAAWWRKHKDHIKDALEANLKAIKDGHIKDHIRDNFMDRWHAISEWASEDKPKNFKEQSLFSDTFHRPVHIHDISSRYLDVNSFLDEHKDKDPNDMMNAIYGTIRKQPDAEMALAGVIRNVAGKMSVEDLADHVVNNSDNDQASVLRDLVFSQPRRKAMDILKAVQTLIDLHPEASRPSMPFVKRAVDRMNQGLDPFLTENDEVA